MVSDGVSTNWNLSYFRVWVSQNSSPWVGDLLIAFFYISKNFHVIIYIIFNTKIEKTKWEENNIYHSQPCVLDGGGASSV